jgi:hypothetical protein
VVLVRGLGLVSFPYQKYFMKQKCNWDWNRELDQEGKKSEVVHTKYTYDNWILEHSSLT